MDTNAKDGAELRFEITMDRDGEIRVVGNRPCSRKDIRDMCLWIADACGAGHPFVTLANTAD